MKRLQRWYSLFFVFSIQMVSASNLSSIPLDLLGTMAPEKKSKNNLMASVMNSASVEDAKSATGQDAKESKSSGTVDNFLEGMKTADQKDQKTAKEVETKPEELDNTETNQSISSVEATDNKTEINDKEPEDSTEQVETKDAQDASESKEQEPKQEETQNQAKEQDPTVQEAKDTEKKDDSEVKKHEPKEEPKKEEAKKEPGVLYQDSGFVDDHESVTFNFEETDLANVASYMEKIHNVKFITEDIVSPNKDAKGLSGHKLTFRTNKVLTKRESWDLFITFLHIAGLDVVPMPHAGFYKIVSFSKANHEAIPAYIGVDANLLPDNDMVIRYVYFARNVDPAKVQNVLKNMQSGSAKLDVFHELKAMIFTDRSCNIKSLMQIVAELDKAVMPESLSVIRLHRANVDDVIKLYSSLKPGGGQTQQRGVWQQGKKEPTLEYFPQDVQLFPDKRTNSLILLGSAKGIKKIEEFVQQYVDIDVTREVPPIFTYQLEYTNANDIKSILTQTIQYGSNTPAGQAGGVRDGVKYFSKMTIVAEPHSNSLIINSSKEDFEAIKPLIQELDIAQKQIGLEVLIIQVSDSETKTLGSQLSGPGGPNAGDSNDRSCQTFAQSLSSQTSGIMSASGSSTSLVVRDNTSNTAASENFSIKTSLSKLLTNGIVNEAGSILVTFGKPIWALFKILKTMISVHVVANPFVVVSNNSTAKVSIGEERRIKASEVVSSGQTVATGFTPQQSTLGFTITPQINKDNIVNLKINVTNNQFSVAGSESSALMDKKEIDTYASVANGEVLVLGGIMQEQSNSTHRGVPFLENIPLLGWFFKSKVKFTSRNHFLIFISPRVLDPVHQNKPNGMDRYTQYKMEEAQKNVELMNELDWFASKRDPIQKSFFGDLKSKSIQDLTGQMVDHEAIDKKKKKKKQDNAKEIVLTKSKIKPKKEKVSKKYKKEKHKKVKSDTKQNDIPSLDKDFIHYTGSSVHAKNAISKSVMHGGSNV